MIIHQAQDDPELNIGCNVNIKFINQTLKKMLLCHLIDESGIASQHLSNQYNQWASLNHSVQGRNSTQEVPMNLGQQNKTLMKQKKYLNKVYLRKTIYRIQNHVVEQIDSALEPP